MGVSKRNPWLSGLGVLLAVLTVYGGAVRADVTTDTPGSIVIFPKVIADGTRDTLIQLTNTSNVPAQAHCWYFDATNNCQPDNFFVDLTPQQPTAWRASTGRFTGETRCDAGTNLHQVCANDTECPSGKCVSTPGIFIGNVKPLIGFQGELKCVQVDASSVPMMGNSLKGEAILETLFERSCDSGSNAGGACIADGQCPPSGKCVSTESGQISAYNAIAIQAMNNPMPTCSGGARNGEACTGGSDCCDPSTGLNCGTCAVQLRLDNATYNACPRDLVATHYAEGATDLFSGATVTSEITLVPCTEDIETDRPTGPDSIPVIAAFRVDNEQEVPGLSGGIPFTCWLNVSLDDPRLGGIFNASIAGTFVKTRVVTNANNANTGLVGIVEEFHALGTGPVGTAAINFHGVGSRTPGGDVIILPQQTGK